MNVYILTALSIRNGKSSKTKPMAFGKKEDALAMLSNRIKIDLLNLSDFREDMDIYQQEDFMEAFLIGSNFVTFNGYEVMFNKNTSTYTRRFPYDGSTFEIYMEGVCVE